MEYFSPTTIGNVTTNTVDTAAYLHILLGPRNTPMSVWLPLGILYVLIFITGVGGNIIICIVVMCDASLHTATNVYLISLAASDLIMLLVGKSL